MNYFVLTIIYNILTIFSNLFLYIFLISRSSLMHLVLMSMNFFFILFIINIVLLLLMAVKDDQNQSITNEPNLYDFLKLFKLQLLVVIVLQFFI